MEDIKGRFEEIKHKAGILKAISHPVRLCIVKGLMTVGDCNVTTIQNCLDLPQPTVSQHLAKLRDLGIIEAERHGVEIRYQVIDSDVIRVAEALFGAD